jgi:gliding motility-associated lipoprotein GldD
VLFFITVLVACQNTDYTPKPRGYYRIEFPSRVYQKVEISGCPFYFESPVYGHLQDDHSRNAKPCWKNLDFPQFNARLHMSYSPINKNISLGALTEDARTFAFKHTAKATAIDQNQIDIAVHDVYGLEYDIKGNTASNYQFYVTDSAKHYVRGALYFNEKPNMDSIQPVLDFLKEDMRYIISTLRWR